MKKRLIVSLAALSIVMVMLTSVRGTAHAIGPTAELAIAFQGVHLAPDSQTQDAAGGVANLQVVADWNVCFFSSFNQVSPTTIQTVCGGFFLAPVTVTAGAVLGATGMVTVQSGPNAGLQLPFSIPTLTFSTQPGPGQIQLQNTGQFQTFQSSAAVHYPDASHRPGDDLLVANANVTLCSTLNVTAPPDENCGSFNTTSNPANVHWIKTGAIDTGIFVRRTPVVEQAAPAAPQIAAPVTGTGRISPPNTGDAGLAATDHRSSLTPLAFVVAGVLLLLVSGGVLQRRLKE